jgi:hypothetical protein
MNYELLQSYEKISFIALLFLFFCISVQKSNQTALWKCKGKNPIS